MAFPCKFVDKWRFDVSSFGNKEIKDNALKDFDQSFKTIELFYFEKVFFLV